MMPSIAAPFVEDAGEFSSSMKAVWALVAINIPLYLLACCAASSGTNNEPQNQPLFFCNDNDSNRRKNNAASCRMYSALLAHFVVPVLFAVAIIAVSWGQAKQGFGELGDLKWQVSPFTQYINAKVTYEVGWATVKDEGSYSGPICDELNSDEASFEFGILDLLLSEVPYEGSNSKGCDGAMDAQREIVVAFAFATATRLLECLSCVLPTPFVELAVALCHIVSLSLCLQSASSWTDSLDEVSSILNFDSTTGPILVDVLVVIQALALLLRVAGMTKEHIPAVIISVACAGRRNNGTLSKSLLDDEVTGDEVLVTPPRLQQQQQQQQQQHEEEAGMMTQMVSSSSA
jgi:hypothetical protein